MNKSDSRDIDNVLKVSHLRTSFRDENRTWDVLKDISFSVRKGEILGIVGESGSGKSMTFKSIMGIVPEHADVQGEFILEEKRFTQLTVKEKRAVLGNDISIIFQDPMTALNPLKKTGQHLVELLVRVKKISKKEAKEKAIDLFKKVGIANAEMRFHQYPHEFSGGMRQRVLIAMALACQPKLLVADEPTTALDVTIQDQILELLRKLQEEHEMSIVLITHDLGVIATLCTRVLVMYGGRIMEEGLVGEIFSEPKHPYTKALLKSVPRFDSEEKQRLQPIRGSAPNAALPSAGCPFADRCDFVMEKCKTELPAYTNYSATQKSMCFFTEKAGDLHG